MSSKNTRVSKTQKSCLNICVAIITQGGAVAAPIGGKVLAEVLPYLEAQKDNIKEENIKKDIEVPNIEGLTIDEAKKRLKDVNLNISIEDMEEKEGTEIITQQLPKAGIKVKEGVAIIAYN